MNYNHYMRGVDQMDQQLDALPVIRRGYKWYKKLLFWIMMQIFKKKLYPLNGGKNYFLKFLHDVCQLFDIFNGLHTDCKVHRWHCKIHGTNALPIQVSVRG